jgi:hypothetical protein
MFIGHRADFLRLGEQFSVFTPVPILCHTDAGLGQAVPQGLVILLAVAPGFEQARVLTQHFIAVVASDGAERRVECTREGATFAR